ncbi:phospholipase [Pseudomonas lini]|uniref:phospholipase n=1 Tax=Pseudomonas lini TaxID=163011 RepID=UPI0006816935|nr:phospholipase [Pseudomonas lini]KNH44148.1 phospholipase [Pseudomonas lini]
MSNSTLENYALNNWMTATPTIDTLSLCELTLPGTHNAGCDWKASYPIIPGAHWLACQHDSFYAQLNNGARALDVRLDFDFEATAFGKFRFQHNGYRSSRNLQILIADINLFLRDNPDEFVILDFHELKNGKQPFDYSLFNTLFLGYLGNRIIPAGNMHLPLGDLKKISRDQRVLVAAPWDMALDRTWFCSKIEHKWSGIGDTNVDELEKHIIEVLKSPPGKWAPWSLSATSYGALGGPVDIHAQLDSWFDPAKSDWAEKCNIINVDFFEETKIVSYCRTVNLKKASNLIK